MLSADTPDQTRCAYDHLVGLLRMSSGEDPLLAPGQRLGGFVIEGLVARGGSATVYRARQPDLGGRLVALKVIRRVDDDPHQRTMFVREARLLASLDHPNLAVVFASGEERDLLWYAMRLEPGDSLQRRFGLGRARPPTRFALRWGVQIADALAAVHRAGLVHRDVKPGNIVLRTRAERGEDLPGAVLIDFGLARRLAPAVDTVTVVDGATPSYASPEQLLGRDVDARTDVFSLCVTLHDLISGRIGIRRTAAAAGLDPLRDLVPEAGADLEAVLARGADPDPRWRYADGAALRDDLRTVLEGRPASARRLGAVERGRRWISRHPGQLLRAMVIVLGLGVLTTGAVWASGRSDLARGVVSAVEGGDLGAAARLGAQMSSLARVLFLTDGEARSLVERLHARRRDDALVAVVEAIEAPGGGLSEGFGVAARHLSSHGIASEPLLERFLLAAFDGLIAGAPEDAAKVAGTQLARLALEQPDESSEAAAAGATWRVVCRGLMERGADKTSLDLALAMLAWRGVGSDVPRLIETAGRHPFGSEKQRLALHAIASIARRSHRLAEAQRIDAPTAWAELVQLARPHWERPSGERAAGTWRSAFALHSATLEVTLSARRVGEPLDVATSMPSHWLEALEAGSADVGDAALLLAASGDLRVADWLRRLERYSDAQWVHWPELELGWLCAVLEDEDLARLVRGRLPGLVRDAQDHLAADRFDEGWASGMRTLKGHIDRPAPEARLGAVVVTKPVLIDLPRHEASAESGAAVWSLEFSPRMSGWATEAIGTAVHLVHEATGGQYLDFRTPGVSRLALHFEVDEPVLDAQMELRGQVAARRTLPGSGAAVLDVRLDGELVSNDRHAANENVANDGMRLPAQRLTPGPHQVTIELTEESTTGYWLLTARIVTAP